MNYLEMVKADATTAIKEALPEFLANHDAEILTTDLEDDFRDYFNDLLWADDSVTGNASGSYFFSRSESKECVLSDMETVSEALKEFCVDAAEIGKRFLDEDWEYLDVTARCYVLGMAIDEIFEMLCEEKPETERMTREELVKAAFEISRDNMEFIAWSDAELLSEISGAPDDVLMDVIREYNEEMED